MTDTQLYFAIGVPVLFNAIMLTLLLACLNARFAGVDKRFDGMNQRFDDMRDMWRTDLRRLEEVMDARLKHLEER